MSSLPKLSLMYHGVGNPPEDSKFPLQHVEPARFRSQMALLSRFGIHGLSAEKAERAESGKSLVITFDDGYRNFLQNALPILKEFNFSATVFIVAGQIGGANVWDMELGEPRQALMSEAEIRECLAAGIEIGAHTYSHPNLLETSESEQVKEIAGSGEFLRGVFNVPVGTFCYPYGYFDEAVVDKVKKAGYKWAFSTRKGVNGRNADPFALRRMNCTADLTPFRFARNMIRLLAIGR